MNRNFTQTITRLWLIVPLAVYALAVSVPAQVRYGFSLSLSAIIIILLAAAFFQVCGRRADPDEYGNLPRIYYADTLKWVSP
jgi:hypothetical protein